ncbi:MAG: hypothetical protein IPF58_04830 [Saprospirales bacterium]|nr:hypothetical protein [Saprospirales bacterium]
MLSSILVIDVFRYQIPLLTGVIFHSKMHWLHQLFLLAISIRDLHISQLPFTKIVAVCLFAAKEVTANNVIAITRINFIFFILFNNLN